MPFPITTETLQNYLKNLAAAQRRCLPADLEDRFLEAYHRKNNESSSLSIDEASKNSASAKLLHMNQAARA